MIELDELKTFVKYTKPGPSDDDPDLLAALLAGVEHVSAMCGALDAAAIVDEPAEARNGYLILKQDPAGATVTVTANGSPLDTTGWTRTTFGFSGVTHSGPVRVSYSVGSEEWPGWARMAVLNWAKYVWQSRLGPRDASKATDAKRTAEALMAPHLIHPRV
jgi:hypothetical protein